MANKFQALLALLGKNKQAQGQTLVPMGEFPSIRGQSQIPIEENPLYLSMRGQAPAHVSMRAKQPTHVSMRGMKPPVEMDKNLLPPDLMPIGEYPSMRGEKAPVPEMQDPRLDALNRALPNLPSLNTNATAQNAGIQTLQQAQWQQQHPLLAGIKKGANKAKHYLLDPVYNTPTGDASIDATDPNKFTDSRLGRYGSLALLAGAGLATGAPAMGIFAGAKLVGGMRANDLAEYRARLGKKADLDTYKQLGMQVNPLASKEALALSVKQQGVNRQNKANASMWASPKDTLKRYVQPSVGQNSDGRYSSGISEFSPFEYVPESTAINQQQSLQQQKQNQQAQQALAEKRLELDRKKQQLDFILNTKKFDLSQEELAQKERQFQQKHGLEYQEFQLKVSESRKQKPQETSQLERAFANGYIGEQEFVNAIAGNPRDKLDGTVINVPLQPKKATPKQEEAKKALLRTSQDGYQTSAGTLPAINLTFGR